MNSGNVSAKRKQFSGKQASLPFKLNLSRSRIPEKDMKLVSPRK